MIFIFCDNYCVCYKHERWHYISIQTMIFSWTLPSNVVALTETVEFLLLPKPNQVLFSCINLTKTLILNT